MLCITFLSVGHLHSFCQLYAYLSIIVGLIDRCCSFGDRQTIFGDWTHRHFPTFLDDGICHSNLGNLETEMSDMEGPTPITRTYVGVYVCTHLYIYIYMCVCTCNTYIYMCVCTCNTISRISDMPQLIYGLHIFRMGLIYRLMNGSGCLKHPRLKPDASLGTQASFAQRYIYIWKYLAKCITN